MWEHSAVGAYSCGNVRSCGNTVLWECMISWEHSAVGMYDVVGTQCCGNVRCCENTVLWECTML